MATAFQVRSEQVSKVGTLAEKKFMGPISDGVMMSAQGARGYSPCPAGRPSAECVYCHARGASLRVLPPENTMRAGVARRRASVRATIPGYHPPTALNIACSAKMAKTVAGSVGSAMKTLTAKDAKYSFGRLIDLARAEPVTVAKHGRPVVVVMAVEEYERLMVLESRSNVRAIKQKAKE